MTGLEGIMASSTGRSSGDKSAIGGKYEIKISRSGVEYSKEFPHTGYKSVSKDDLLLQLKKLRQINKISICLIFSLILVVTSFFSLFGLFFLLTALFGLVLKLLLKSIWSVSLIYEFDDMVCSSKYASLQNTFSALGDNCVTKGSPLKLEKFDGKWVRVREHYDIKQVFRIPIQKPHKAFSKILPIYIKSNVEIYSLPISVSEMICFAPDGVISLKGSFNSRVKMLSYEDMTIDFSYIGYYNANSSKIPDDSTQVGHSENVVRFRKDGYADQRYNTRSIEYWVYKHGKVDLSLLKYTKIELIFKNDSLVYQAEAEYKNFSQSVANKSSTAAKAPTFISPSPETISYLSIKSIITILFPLSAVAVVIIYNLYQYGFDIYVTIASVLAFIPFFLLFITKRGKNIVRTVICTLLVVGITFGLIFGGNYTMNLVEQDPEYLADGITMIISGCLYGAGCLLLIILRRKKRKIKPI